MRKTRGEIRYLKYALQVTNYIQIQYLYLKLLQNYIVTSYIVVFLTVLYVIIVVLLQYMKERDRMLQTYFICSVFIYLSITTVQFFILPQ